MTDRPSERGSSSKSAVLAVGAGLCLYLLSSLLVFDFSRTAIAGDEEYFEGRDVAVGPEPRWPFTYGGDLDIPGGWDFSGREPVFWVYRPVCLWWLARHGYAPPAAWR